MWSKVAEEMAIPWRAAEAMHWQLGEADMARRAGVVPFSLSSITADAPSASHRSLPSWGHSHSQPQFSGHLLSGSSFSRPATAHSAPRSTKGRGGGSARTIAAQKDSTSKLVPLASLGDGPDLAGVGGDGMAMGTARGRVLFSAPKITSVFKNTSELPE
jgi:hypothetical protein